MSCHDRFLHRMKLKKQQIKPGNREARKRAEEAVKKRAREQKAANGEKKYVTMIVKGTRVYAPIGMPEDEVKWRRYRSEIPHHCDLGSAVKPHHTFNVTSGTLRFGPEDLVRALDSGALVSNEAAWSYQAIGPTFVTARVSAISTIFNPTCTFRAYNGKWLIYRLEKRVAPQVCPEFNSKTGELVKKGWFVCHSAISSPLKEARNLLYHGYFGDELIKCDGAYVSQYPKPIEYHRFDYSNGNWKVSTAQGEIAGAKYLIGDSRFPQAAFDLTTDGVSRNQSCIIGFAKKDAAKSFLLFDNDCDMEQTYFRQTRLPVYAMPWTKLPKVKPDENDDRFFILSTPSSTDGSYVRSKHRYVLDLLGQPLATCPAYESQGILGSDEAIGRQRKRLRTIKSFFGPAGRGGKLAVLPSDVINPHLLKFLTLRDCLPLVMTCKYLKNILDPYEYGHIFDLQPYQIDEDIIPESLRCPDTGRLTVEIEDYVEEQDTFIAKRAGSSFFVVRSVFKNEVMSRKYHLDGECRGDANELVRRIVRNLIRHEQTVSLEHVASLNRVSAEAFYFAIRCEATESVAALRKALKADEWARKCTKCNTEVGAYSCRRNGAITKDCVQHDETQEPKDEYVCQGCRFSVKHAVDTYCQICDRYECSECRGRFHGGGVGHDTHITYGSCHECKRNVCFARHEGKRPYSCSLRCSSCNVVVCRDCSKTQWYHCSKCYSFSSGQIKPFCGECSKSGCPDDEWGWHATKYLHPHYFRTAEVVEYEASEEEESAESDSDGGGEDPRLIASMNNQILRTCRDCHEEKSEDYFYARQWSRPVECRLCKMCHDKRLREGRSLMGDGRSLKRSYYRSTDEPPKKKPFEPEFYYETHAYLQREENDDDDSDDEYYGDHEGESYALCSSIFDSRKQPLITNFFRNAYGQTTNACITPRQMNALAMRDEKIRLRQELLDHEEIDVSQYVFEDYKDWHDDYSRDRVLSIKYKGYTLADLKKKVHFQFQDGHRELCTVKECLKKGGVKIQKGLWSGPWHEQFSEKKKRESERRRLIKMIYKAIS